MKLHLMQQEVADWLGVHVESLKNWERGAGSPTIRQIPKIIKFLGYDPESAPKTILEPSLNARRLLGLTQKELANTLEVHPVTVYRWEQGLSVPPAKTVHRLLELVKEKPSTTPR